MSTSWEISVKAQYFISNSKLNDSNQLLDVTKRMRSFIKDNPLLEITGFDVAHDSEFGWNGIVSWYGGML